jgi:hypothetical protein
LKLRFYRVNFEVSTLKPFPHLAFPRFPALENTSKQPNFDGELMTGSRWSYGLITSLAVGTTIADRPARIRLHRSNDGRLAPTLFSFKFLAGDQSVKILRAFLLVCGSPALQDDFTNLGDTPGFLRRDRLKALLQFGLDPKG